MVGSARMKPIFLGKNRVLPENWKKKQVFKKNLQILGFLKLYR